MSHMVLLSKMYIVYESGSAIFYCLIIIIFDSKAQRNDKENIEQCIRKMC